ncbi:MAG TPA: ZIP family metal transporter [Longimicrobiales bacterium]|nr:ZIP family metal transporter [Longimicrobiales bacterium]
MTGVLYAALASLGDIGGGLLVIWRTGRDRGLLAALTGFGAGFMLALVILGMLPHVVDVPGGFIAVLVGYLVVHLTQHSLTPHFHFGEETHADAMVSRGIGVWALVGLLPHSFFDGVAISSGFLESSSLGVLVFTGILLHKVPTGVSLGSIMLASGNTPRKTMGAVLGIAAATIAGALVTPFVGAMAEYGLPLAAGVTLYVAASNLIPEAQHERSFGVHGGFIAGVIAYVLLQMLLPDVH